LAAKDSAVAMHQTGAMTVPAEHRQVMIASLPQGRLEPSDFAVRTAAVPVPGEGEVLCRTIALTIGAGQRAGLQGSASYAGAPEAGRVMGGTGVAEVMTAAGGLLPGDVVWAPTGWQEYSVHAPKVLTKLDPTIDAAEHLGVLGTNGLTAYFGVRDVGAVQAGDTMVVSAAAGSVGHIAGQIGTILGARVVGIVGSADKARLLTERLGFAAALDRRSSDFRADFKAATPDRIDVYFDNTGGDLLESALFRMNRGGRIACCGVVSQYDTNNPAGGPRGVPGLLINNRVRMEGFLVFDFAHRYDEARAQMSTWMREGRLTALVTEYQGLASAPQAFVDLLAGTTTGTTVVRL
jgi:NADPH-dependent curcumin reductase CurA